MGGKFFGGSVFSVKCSPCAPNLLTLGGSHHAGERVPYAIERPAQYRSKRAAQKQKGLMQVKGSMKVKGNINCLK